MIFPMMLLSLFSCDSVEQPKPAEVDNQQEKEQAQELLRKTQVLTGRIQSGECKTEPGRFEANLISCGDNAVTWNSMTSASAELEQAKGYLDEITFSCTPSFKLGVWTEPLCDEGCGPGFTGVYQSNSDEASTNEPITDTTVLQDFFAKACPTDTWQSGQVYFQPSELSTLQQIAKENNLQVISGEGGLLFKMQDK